MAYQQGSIYLHNDTSYLKYRITGVGGRNRLFVFTRHSPFCKGDGEHPGYEKKDKETGKSKIVPSVQP